MKIHNSELLKRKSLIWDFAITDLKLRYRNSILGFFWTVLEPLLMFTVLYFVFTNIFKGQIEHYALYLFLGIIMWNMFSRGTTMSLNSLVGRSGVISQIYFPREIVAISSTITASIMFGFELLVFGIFLIVLQFVPPFSIIFLPFVFIMLFVITLGISIPLSVLNVYYRDVQFIWSVILQAGFFLTPIFYKLDILSPTIKKILVINPIANLINLAHDVTLYNVNPTSEDIIVTIGIVCMIFLVGYVIFKKLESRVVEEL